jgi:hypothetical protein
MTVIMESVVPEYLNFPVFLLEKRKISFVRNHEQKGQIKTGSA